MNFGRGGIRTLDTRLTYTRFPSVLLKPLGHSSVSENKSLSTIVDFGFIVNLIHCRILGYEVRSTKERGILQEGTPS